MSLNGKELIGKITHFKKNKILLDNFVGFYGEWELTGWITLNFNYKKRLPKKSDSKPSNHSFVNGLYR